MKKHNLTWILVAFLSCSNNNGKFHIVGHIPESYNGKIVVLNQYKNEDIYKTDSTIIINGSFSFNGEEFLDGTASIIVESHIPKERIGDEIILERGKIEIFLDTINRIFGGEMNQKFEAFKKIRFYTDSVISVIYENIDNPIGLIIMQKYVYVLPDHVLKNISLQGGNKLRTNPIIKSALQKREKQIQNRIKQRELIGTKYKDVSVITPNGEHKKLSDYIGSHKYTYFNFWASWCTPCIDEIPALNEIYSKYRDKGVQLISISIDENKDAWLTAIKKHNIQGLHLHPVVLEEFMKLFYLDLIPYGVIMDENGRIIKVGVEPDNFEIPTDL